MITVPEHGEYDKTQCITDIDRPLDSSRPIVAARTYTQPSLRRVAMVNLARAIRPLFPTLVHVREARTSVGAESSEAENMAGRIVEFGTALEEAT